MPVNASSGRFVGAFAVLFAVLFPVVFVFVTVVVVVAGRWPLLTEGSLDMVEPRIHAERR
jgi:hypothetical protein